MSATSLCPDITELVIEDQGRDCAEGKKLSGAERAKRAEPHLTRHMSSAIRKKWSKKLLWRAKQALEKIKI